MIAERNQDALEAWELCNKNPRGWSYVPSTMETPEIRSENWAVNVRRCLYYLASTAVPHKKHKLNTIKAARVHPVVVDLLMNAGQLLRVDPVQDHMPNSGSCNIHLAAPVVQHTYYRKLIPYYVELNGARTGINWLNTTDEGTCIPVNTQSESFRQAKEGARLAMVDGASEGVIARFVKGTLNGNAERGHMIAVLFLRNYAYIFDTNTTDDSSATEKYKIWKPLLAAFITNLTRQQPRATAPSPQIRDPPQKLHGIAIKRMDYIAGTYWFGGVGFNIGPQPGNGDCQRATSNIISRLLTTNKVVDTRDDYVSKKIHFNWSWTLLDAVASTHGYIQSYEPIYRLYKQLIELYSYTRRDHLPKVNYAATMDSTNQLRVINISGMTDAQHTLLGTGRVLSGAFKVYRYDTVSTPPRWVRIPIAAYRKNPNEYYLYVTNTDQTVYYRLIPVPLAVGGYPLAPNYTLGERQVYPDAYRAGKDEQGVLKVELVGTTRVYDVQWYDATSSGWKSILYDDYMSHPNPPTLYVSDETKKEACVLTPVPTREGPTFTLGKWERYSYVTTSALQVAVAPSFKF